MYENDPLAASVKEIDPEPAGVAGAGLGLFSPNPWFAKIGPENVPSVFCFASIDSHQALPCVSYVYQVA